MWMRMWWIVCLCLLSSGISQAEPFRLGDLFLANDGDTVTEIDPSDGGTQQTVSVSPEGFATSDSVPDGGGVALDEALNLYVTVEMNDGSGPGIVKFDATGQKVATFGITSTSIDFRGVAVEDGTIYVASSSGVRRYSASDGSSVGSGILDTGTSYRDVAFDNSGNLYGLKGTSVIKWEAGSFSGDGTSVIDSGLSDGRAVAFDGQDNLYVTNGSGRKILKYAKTGGGYSSTPTEIEPSLGAAFGSGDRVIGLAYDSAADVFYASHTETTLDQILRFGPDSTTASGLANTSGYTGARHVDVRPTPELSTVILLGVGLLTLGAIRWRVKTKQREG